MRKKQKETDVSGDEKKDDDDGDEKKPASPVRDDSPPPHHDQAAKPPGYCTHFMLPWLAICYLTLIHHSSPATGCANKKQSFSKNSLSQLL